VIKLETLLPALEKSSGLFDRPSRPSKKSFVAIPAMICCPRERRTPGGSDVVIKFEPEAGSSTGTRTPE